MALNDLGSGRSSPYPYQSRNGANSPPLPSTSLSHAHITEALQNSPDNGATLDLTHRNLTDVGELGAEELATIGRKDSVDDESSVLRVALGYNRLATLPMAFALLSRLRYLNLKNNSFSIFPDVLTVMPSLEILDISRNKIKRLPSQPGSLATLRVFCVSRNKLNRLPAYLSNFRNLSILKTDHNPIEWPPKVVMEPPGGVEDPKVMKGWIQTIQKWMDDNSSRTEVREGRKHSDESLTSEKSDLDSAVDDSIQLWSKFPILDNEYESDVGHARSFSMDSDFSAYSIEEEETPSAEPMNLDSPRSDRPPPLHLGMLSSYAGVPSPPRSPDSYLPSPELSTDEDTTAVAGSLQQQLHARNASFASGSHSAGNDTTHSNLSGKKSLPDLRTAEMNFGGVKRIPNLPTRNYTTGPDMPSARFDEGFSIPSPVSLREDSGSSDGRPIPRPVKTFVQEPVSTSPTAIGRSAPSMDVERNSYFRRLSTLPSSTISAAIPSSLLSLIDAARSILFAVSQVYQSLQHYTVYAIDERLSSILKKVLDPASAYMMQLINALDRFDHMSRRGLPSPTICRSVIECCKDTVAVFGKAVGVLALQLKVLATHDDVRYLRQMLLVLYGATAEISYAWQAMAPHIAAVKPLLRENRKIPSAKALAPVLRVAPSTPGMDQPSSAPPVSVPFQPWQSPAGPLPRAQAPQSSGASGSGRTRIARRQAGSFSSRDVEIGKKLPAFEEIPQTPTLRPGLRKPALGPSPTVSNGGFGPQSQAGPSSSGSRPAPHVDHSRQSSQTSLISTSAPISSSPKAPLKLPTLEVPNSKTLVDREALDAMHFAVEAAPDVWEMMDEILSETDNQDAMMDARDNLTRAKIVTERLRENISAVQQGLPSADKKTLREDAHVFVKIVVQLSHVIKTYGGAHAVFPDLRSRMVKLTNSTEEFVILLHVSSFSSSSAPRPYSPMVTTNGNGTSAQASLLAAPTDDSSSSGLSRSRSAQAAVTAKLLLPGNYRDGPRSAQPSQSFNVPLLPRQTTRNWDGGDFGDG